MKSIYISIILAFCFFIFVQVNFHIVKDPDTLINKNITTQLYSFNVLGKVVYLNSKKSKEELYNNLHNTNGLAFDSEGYIYVVEHTKSQIIKFDENGGIIKTFKVPDGYPLHIIKSLNSNDMIFTNVTDNSINKLTEDGTITKLYKGFPLDAPVGLAFDDEGVLYVSNYEEKKVFALINQELKYITTLPGKVTSKCGKKE